MNSSSHLMQSPDEKGDFYSMSPHSCLPALNRSGETYLAPWHHVYIHHTYSFPSKKKMYTLPWLVWLSGLSTGLWTKGSPVWFPVRAHAWVAGQVPSWGVCVWCFSCTSMFLSQIDVSLPLFPSLPLSLKIESFFKKRAKSTLKLLTHRI